MDFTISLLTDSLIDRPIVAYPIFLFHKITAGRQAVHHSVAVDEESNKVRYQQATAKREKIIVFDSSFDSGCSETYVRLSAGL